MVLMQRLREQFLPPARKRRVQLCRHEQVKRLIFLAYASNRDERGDFAILQNFVSFMLSRRRKELLPASRKLEKTVSYRQ